MSKTGSPIETVLWGVAVAALTAVAAAAARRAIEAAPQVASSRVAIDRDDIGGVVSGPSGAEAGVWVIAEATNLDTKFRKIVVTDDGGHFVVPDLPPADYSVWVRGYGLVDSQPVQAVPGRTLALTAVPAPNAGAAAEIYPSNYWYSLIRVPAKNEFPGT